MLTGKLVLTATCRVFFLVVLILMALLTLPNVSGVGHPSFYSLGYVTSVWGLTSLRRVAVPCAVNFCDEHLGILEPGWSHVASFGSHC